MLVTCPVLSPLWLGHHYYWSVCHNRSARLISRILAQKVEMNDGTSGPLLVFDNCCKVRMTISESCNYYSSFRAR